MERDAIVTEDGELTMAIARQIMPTHIARHRLGAGTTGCMGTGLPYALGAKLAKPDRQVIAILGDYAFGAAAMEVETCARWNIPIVIIVSNNAGIAAHTIQDRSFSEDAPPIAALLPIHYEKMVEMVGGYSERVTNPDEIKPAITRALASGKVSLLNVITDPKAQRRGGGYLYLQIFIIVSIRFFLGKWSFPRRDIYNGSSYNFIPQCLTIFVPKKPSSSYYWNNRKRKR